MGAMPKSTPRWSFCCESQTFLTKASAASLSLNVSRIALATKSHLHVVVFEKLPDFVLEVLGCVLVVEGDVEVHMEFRLAPDLSRKDVNQVDSVPDHVFKR